jgi:hypothetical protein
MGILYVVGIFAIAFGLAHLRSYIRKRADGARAARESADE